MQEDIAAAKEGYAPEDVFICHAGPQKDSFAVCLKRELQRHGISAFLPEHDSKWRLFIRAACTGAKLVIFVLTRTFICNRACLDELRWVLKAREDSGGHLPEVLTILYPGGADEVSLNDLNPLSKELIALLERRDENPASQQHALSTPASMEGTKFEQIKLDLDYLSKLTLLRGDASER